MALRIIFMGTPDFAVPTLLELIGQGHEIVAVYAQPPRPAGRGMAPRNAPVHEKALEFGLPVFTPNSLKEAGQLEAFQNLDADVAVVIAYGQILPVSILAAPRLGCFNGHASLLPRWRGAAPIQRAIMAGDRESGVSIMQMEAGLDTGPVAMQERIAIEHAMTANELHDALSNMTADLFVRALGALERGTLVLTPQDEEGVTYAQKIDKQESRIDWSESAQKVHNHIRGLSPFPGAWCEMPIGGKPVRVKILRSELAAGNGQAGTVLDDHLTIACGEGAIRLLKVQRAGKQAQSAGEFLLGNSVPAGEVIN